MPRWPCLRPFLGLREGQGLRLVIAGEGVELAIPQSNIASGTSQTLRGTSLADRIERPPAERVQPALPRWAGRKSKKRSRGISSGSEYEKNRLEKGVKRI
ncbi:hypothetical protein PENFLA_c041G04947 [Penicillium flavigenum]|uniref:Uncharacterized protein n=1 Tax=Penicillium flavigenum TaxID=254877 RepID=A0A1V6SIX9_9EURO|nr:hypothetical protein PENFLA_c041G04947 [Penicillium flavigenum]